MQKNAFIQINMVHSYLCYGAIHPVLISSGHLWATIVDFRKGHFIHKLHIRRFSSGDLIIQ